MTSDVIARAGAAATAPTAARAPGSFTLSLRVSTPVLVGGIALLGAAGLGAWFLARRGSDPAPPAPNPTPPTPSPTAPPTPTPTPAPVPQPAFDVRVGQLNAKNLFDTVDDPAKQDDVPTAEHHAQHLRKLALTVRDVLHAPDVIALQEVENEHALRELATHPELAGLGYEGILREGRDPRGIDVALMYRRDRVQPVAIETWDPLGASPSGRRTRTFTRPPLVVDFAPAGAPDGSSNLRVATAHLTSRLQGADGERRRSDQAAALSAGVDAAAGGAGLVLAGDLNMAPGEAPYEALVGPRDAAAGPRLLEPLSAIPLEERYSYRRGRTRELLDHVLVTPRAGLQVTDPAIPHVNTEATAAAVRDPDHPAGASDHDPVVVRVRVPQAAAPVGAPTS